MYRLKIDFLAGRRNSFLKKSLPELKFMKRKFPPDRKLSNLKTRNFLANGALRNHNFFKLYKS